MAVKPIRPNEAIGKKLESMPDAVIEAFNELISEHFDNGEARFKKNEVVTRIVSKGVEKKAIFANHWLDVEEIYEKAGWDVEYDKPGYNETYEAEFIFSQRSRNSKY